jgi:hypothetical protein
MRMKSEKPHHLRVTSRASKLMNNSVKHRRIVSVRNDLASSSSKFSNINSKLETDEIKMMIA